MLMVILCFVRGVACVPLVIQKSNYYKDKEKYVRMEEMDGLWYGLAPCKFNQPTKPLN